jgi:hypothetical protein
MNSQYKNKLYNLGRYLLNEGMKDEFLMLIKISKNFNYNNADDYVLTPELAKEHGLEHLLPIKDLEVERYGEIFNHGTRMRDLIDEVFYSTDKKRDLAAKQQWIDEFLDRNSAILAQYDPVEHLGSGTYADAWETDDGHVIKIIRDDKDLSFYKEQQEALHSGKGSSQNIMVYDMGIFDVPWAIKPYDVRHLKRMSWVILEKLEPLRDFVRRYDQQLGELSKFLSSKDSEFEIGDKLLTRFKESFSDMKILISDKVASVIRFKDEVVGSSPEEIRNYAFQIEKWFISTNEYKNEIKPIFQEVENRVGLPDQWMENIIYSMVLHLLNNDDDLHSGNVGFIGNQPVYYDPSNRHHQYSMPPLEYSEKSIPKIDFEEAYIEPEETAPININFKKKEATK